MKDYYDTIDTIDSLEALYTFVEDYALKIEEDHDPATPFLKYRSKTTDAAEKRLLKWEIEVASFSFIGKKLFSFAAANGASPGEILQYPNHDQMEQEAIAYIKERAATTKSLLLKARYNHILWQNPVSKNRMYAQEAYDAYCATVRFCLAKSLKHRDLYLSVIGRLFENAFGLVATSNLPAQVLKETANELLMDNSIPFWVKHNLVEDMLDNPKIFKPIDFTSVLQLFTDQVESAKENRLEDFLLVNQYMPTAIKLAQKTGLPVQSWYDQIGYAYLRMVAKEDDQKRNSIKQIFYTEAINAFRLSGNTQEKKKVEQLYFELKDEVTLDHHTRNFNQQEQERHKETQKTLKKKAEELLLKSPEHIYRTISTGHFFPDYETIDEILKRERAPWLEGVSSWNFDQNKNISKLGKEEESRNELFMVYGQKVSEVALPFLHHTIISGIKEGHLTVENFMMFLLSNTWIGKPDFTKDLSGTARGENWIFQIAPSIKEFFSQVRAWGESNYYFPSFMLCTDSLTLKIEGLFRNFSKRLNVSTSIGKRKGTQEALAHDILSNEDIMKYFNQNDRLLFDYVFSNEGGLNLRNNIAHCFYSPDEYHPDKMLLLLAILLRLGKYNMTIERKET